MGWFRGDSSDEKTEARRKLNEAILGAVGDTNADTEYFKARQVQRQEESRLLLVRQRQRRSEAEASKTRMNLAIDNWESLNGPVAAEEYPKAWTKKALMNSGPRFLAMMSDILARRDSHGRGLEQKAEQAQFRRAQGAIASGYDLDGDCTLDTDFEAGEQATEQALREHMQARDQWEEHMQARAEREQSPTPKTEQEEP